MPPTFYFPTRDKQMWTALTLRGEDFADRTDTYIEAVGRLKPGVTFEEARTELQSLAARLARDYPQTNAETGVSFYRMRDNIQQQPGGWHRQPPDELPPADRKRCHGRARHVDGP